MTLNVLLDPTVRCWSWRDDHSTPYARFNTRTCQAHADEQPLMDSVDERLRDLSRNLEELKMTQHPDSAKSLAEHALRKLISSFLPGWSLVPGFYGERQADAVAVHEDFTLQALCTPPNEPLKAHLEITHSGGTKWSNLKRKLITDLDRLDASISTARRAGRKCWTALVLLGPGWEGLWDQIAEILHYRYHRRDLDPYDAALVGPTIPMPDAICAPDGIFKKHKYFTEKSRESRAIPAFGWMPRSPSDNSTPYRPVMVIIGFLAHFLIGLDLPELFDKPAAPKALFAALMGPKRKPGSSDLVALLRSPTGRVLYYAKDKANTGWGSIVVENSTKCSKGCCWKATYPETLVPDS